MEIQNISGADIITQRLSVNSSISNENVRPESNTESENNIKPEEQKGKLIDIRA